MIDIAPLHRFGEPATDRSANARVGDELAYPANRDEATAERRGSSDAMSAVLVVGAGDATGGAIARRFAREGYVACVTRRTADKLAPLGRRHRAGGRRGARLRLRTRATRKQTLALFSRIEREIAPIEVVVFNIGANVRFGVTETTARVYQKVWEMALLRRIPDRARSGAHDAAAPARLDLLHRRDRQPARTRGVLRLRRRQARAARSGPEHGARARPAGHPRRPPDHRRRDRHAMDPREFPRALCAARRPTGS